MVNNPTTVQRSMRLRSCNGFMSHAIIVPIFGHPRGVKVSAMPITGLAQGRIVSISRGFSPPKKR